MTGPGPTDGGGPRRAIVHVDMDCFYAAIEEREHPQLRGRPLAVGGSSRRGVLTTANYEARKFGCRSAMPVFRALELCPHLILLPVRFELYRAESARIRAIFRRFTDLIEPLSLDEAYLDVSALRSAPAVVAREIRAQIREETGLTASAGIGPNKLVAKIASDWNKPDGQHEVREEEVDAFLAALPVGRLWGVGGRMKERLAELGVETCGDLRRFDKIEMARRFGKWGLELWELCRGIDERPVRNDRIRKSLSSEHTLSRPAREPAETVELLRGIVAELGEELVAKHGRRRLRSQFVKFRFADFRRTTVERAVRDWRPELFAELAEEAWRRARGRAVRLVGAGLRFAPEERTDQLDFFR